VREGFGPLILSLKRIFGGGVLGGGVPDEPFLLRAARAAPVPAVLVAAGALGFLLPPLIRLARHRALEEAERARLVTAVWCLVFVFTYVRMNPFLFPYNFVVLMPVLGVLASGIR